MEENYAATRWVYDRIVEKHHGSGKNCVIPKSIPKTKKKGNLWKRFHRFRLFIPATAVAINGLMNAAVKASKPADIVGHLSTEPDTSRSRQHSKQKSYHLKSEGGVIP